MRISVDLLVTAIAARVEFVGAASAGAPSPNGEISLRLPSPGPIGVVAVLASQTVAMVDILDASIAGVPMIADQQFVSTSGTRNLRLFWLAREFPAGIVEVIVRYAGATSIPFVQGGVWSNADAVENILRRPLLDGGVPNDTVVSKVGDAVVSMYHASNTGGWSMEWIHPAIERLDQPAASITLPNCYIADAAGSHSVLMRAISTPSSGTQHRGVAFNIRAAGSIATPPSTNLAPIWDSSVIEFTNGVQKTVDLASRVSDPDGDPLSISVSSGLKPELEGAFHFDSATFELIYDGRDILGSPDDQALDLDTGIVLIANDGKP